MDRSKEIRGQGFGSLVTRRDHTALRAVIRRTPSPAAPMAIYCAIRSYHQ